MQRAYANRGSHFLTCSVVMCDVLVKPDSLVVRGGTLTFWIWNVQSIWRSGYVSVLVEAAVIAPDIAKVDTDRHLNPGILAGTFRDEVLRWLRHGNSLVLLRRTCSSHFSVPIRYVGSEFALNDYVVVLARMAFC